MKKYWVLSLLLITAACSKFNFDGNFNSHQKLISIKNMLYTYGGQDSDTKYKVTEEWDANLFEWGIPVRTDLTYTGEFKTIEKVERETLAGIAARNMGNEYLSKYSSIYNVKMQFENKGDKYWIIVPDEMLDIIKEGETLDAKLRYHGRIDNGEDWSKHIFVLNKYHFPKLFLRRQLKQVKLTCMDEAYLDDGYNKVLNVSQMECNCDKIIEDIDAKGTSSREGVINSYCSCLSTLPREDLMKFCLIDVKDDIKDITQRKCFCNKFVDELKNKSLTDWVEYKNLKLGEFENWEWLNNACPAVVEK
jgi:hypothetical protein